MGARKFFVMLTAVFLVVAMSLPAYAASFGGTIDNTALGIDRIVWGYDETTVIDGINTNVDPFFVNFYDENDLVLQFTASDVVPYSDYPTVILASNAPVEVNYSSITYTYAYCGNTIHPNTTLNIDDTNYFWVDGVDCSGDISVTGYINFIPVVPIPGAVWLFVSGLAGLMGLKRMFRKTL